jgi:hypothetical protein
MIDNLIDIVEVVLHTIVMILSVEILKGESSRYNTTGIEWGLLNKEKQRPIILFQEIDPDFLSLSLQSDTKL